MDIDLLMRLFQLLINLGMMGYRPRRAIIERQRQRVLSDNPYLENRAHTSRVSIRRE